MVNINSNRRPFKWKPTDPVLVYHRSYDVCAPAKFKSLWYIFYNLIIFFYKTNISNLIPTKCRQWNCEIKLRNAVCESFRLVLCYTTSISIYVTRYWVLDTRYRLQVQGCRVQLLVLLRLVETRCLFSFYRRIKKNFRSEIMEYPVLWVPDQ